MKNTPELQTSRLLLKEVQIEDATDIYAYVKNPNVLRYTMGTPPQAFAETESFVQSLATTSDGEFAWAIRIKGNSAAPAPVIGVIEFGLVDQIGGSETGRLDFALAEEHWNKGIMTECVRAVLDWAFGAYPTLATVSSAAMTANPASTRVQQKSGMKLRGKEYRTWSKFDQPIEVSICSISREEWTNQDSV